MIQGDQKRQHIVIFLWWNQFVSKMHKPNDFWQAYIGRFWYFDVQYVSGAKYSFVSRLWQNSVTTPYCRDWEPRYPQTHLSASDFHEFHSDTTRRPPDIPQTSVRHPPDISRDQEMPTDNNRHKQTASDTKRHWQVLFEYIWRCLLAFMLFQNIHAVLLMLLYYSL